MITDIALEHNDTELTLVSQIIELLRLLDTLSDPEIKDTDKTKDLYLDIQETFKKYGEETDSEEMKALSTALQGYNTTICPSLISGYTYNRCESLIEQIELLLITALYKIKCSGLFRGATRETLKDNGHKNTAFAGDLINIIKQPEYKQKVFKNYKLEYVSAWHDTDKDSAVLTFADVKTGLDEDLKSCYKLGDTTIIEYK